MIFDLVKDFANVLETMPEGHPRCRILKLLDEAIRRDVHFIDRHPTTFFQCMWNTCWWYDCPEAVEHYVRHHTIAFDRYALIRRPVSAWIESIGILLATCRRFVKNWFVGFLRSSDVTQLWQLVQSWRTTRAYMATGFTCLRSLRPPPIRLGTPQLSVFRGHTMAVSSVAYSPDGSRIASGSQDNTVRIWDTHTGEELSILRGHAKPVTSVVFTPDGFHLASGSWDKSVRVWDVYSGATLIVLKGHDEAVNSVSYAPDGSLLCSSSDDGSVRIWDVHNSVERAVLRGHNNAVLCAEFSPDGSKLASGSHDDTVRVWDVHTGEALAVLRGHSNSVCSVSFSGDGSQIASGSWDRTARIWNVVTGAEDAVLRGHEFYVSSVSFSPDGSQLVSASFDRSIRVWNTCTGAELTVLYGHDAPVTSVDCSSDGFQFASGSWDTTVRVWNSNMDAEAISLRGHKHDVTSLGFSPDGLRIASSSFDGIRSVWNAHKGTVLTVMIGQKQYAWDRLTFSPDGMHLVDVSWDDVLFRLTIQVWNVRTGNVVATFRGPNLPVADLEFSSDGKQLYVLCTCESKASVWDPLTGECLEEETVHAFHHDDVQDDLHAFVSNRELVVTDESTGFPIAWFPEPLENRRLSPTHYVLAGSVANYVCIIALEAKP